MKIHVISELIHELEVDDEDVNDLIDDLKKGYASEYLSDRMIYNVYVTEVWNADTYDLIEVVG